MNEIQKNESTTHFCSGFLRKQTFLIFNNGFDLSKNESIVEWLENSIGAKESIFVALYMPTTPQYTEFFICLQYTCMIRFCSIVS